jgi:ATP-dependent DNA helicase RecQ
MDNATKNAASPNTSLEAVIARHWGFHSFLPLQEEAMKTVMEGRDSLVVLPTGGGKSLCYQAPAVARGDTSVVISPLIALMKDQVDSLGACGVPAIQIDSSQTEAERSNFQREIERGNFRLVFISPERLVLTDFSRLLKRLGVRAFAIDEAHCISHWGHDFRQEYRQLGRLREHFPEASVHAYTATAREQVRRDIVQQLNLRNAAVLVGNFDRPNLIYRVLPRLDVQRQVRDVLDRHPGEAGIIYCLRRREVDALADSMRKLGYQTMPYHAGMESEERRATQDAFAAEKCDVVVATIAFGMGIDRSNVRFVLHTAMPKSMEHYQQETGRAGRDGLSAECVLLYSGSDRMAWKFLIEKSASESGARDTFVPNALQHLGDLDRYCRRMVCRHRALVQYFGQGYEPASCRACDICLGDTEPLADADVIAKKILSCVARVKESFGIAHVAAVLRGQNTAKILERGHDRLSTFGLLREHSGADVRDWIFQLIGQQVLVQEGDPYPTLRLNEASWEVMRGKRSVRLLQLAETRKKAASRIESDSWEGVDRPLFEALRAERRRLAADRGVQPFIVLSDTTLRELARTRPSTLGAMRAVYGIGDTKVQDFGDLLLAVLDLHCKERGLSRDNVSIRKRGQSRINIFATQELGCEKALELFQKGASVEQVCDATGRASSTVVAYLCEHIRGSRPSTISTWVPDEIYERVAGVAREVGTERLKPIYVALNEEVSYDHIRLVVTHLNSTPTSGA